MNPLATGSEEHAVVDVLRRRRSDAGDRCGLGDIDKIDRDPSHAAVGEIDKLLQQRRRDVDPRGVDRRELARVLDVDRLRRAPGQYPPVHALVFFELRRHHLLADEQQRRLAALVDIAQHLDHPGAHDRVVGLVDDQRPLTGGELLDDQVDIAGDSARGPQAHLVAHLFGDDFTRPHRAHLHVVGAHLVGEVDRGRRLPPAARAVIDPDAGQTVLAAGELFHCDRDDREIVYRGYLHC